MRFGRILTLGLAAAAALAASPAAAGDDRLDSYCARLGSDDHFNSNGVRLTDVAAIIRQDRANFHAFGVQDAEDDGDSFFSSKENRARLEAMLRNGKASKAVRKAIVDGTPLICVDIYENWVEVTLQ